jgi:hypothetical protein
VTNQSPEEEVSIVADAVKEVAVVVTEAVAGEKEVIEEAGIVQEKKARLNLPNNPLQLSEETYVITEY